VGIARYVRDREDPHAAEIAVTVIDGWQGRGLGTELLARLSERACQEGIRRFTAAVAADNAAMTGLPCGTWGPTWSAGSSARWSTRWHWPACRSAGSVSAETRPAGWA